MVWRLVPRGWPPAARAGGALLGAMLLVAVAAPWLAPGSPFSISHEALAPPQAQHPFGTDDLGRDVYTGVVHGARASLLVGLIAAACSTVLGVLVGGAASLRPGLLDHALMRATEFGQSVPRFFLVVVVVSLFGGSIGLIIAAIALTAWPATARVFRAQALAVLARDYVTAARAAGASNAGVVWRHVLPATGAVLAAQVSYQVGGAILSEASLSFLGLGDPTVVSWGMILGAAHQTVSEAWWIALFPGIALTLTVLACNLLGDALGPRPPSRHP